MKKTCIVAVSIILMSLFLSAGVTISSVEAKEQAPKIDSELAKTLAGLGANDQIKVVAYLADEEKAANIKGKDKADTQKNLIKALKKKADDTQAALKGALIKSVIAGKTKDVTPLWIRNAVAFTATPDVISQIAKLPEVGTIVLETTTQAPAKAAVVPMVATAVEANISLVNAPAMWSLGYSGQGVVVANMDTGVDYTHPELSGSYRGGTNSWYDPYNQHATPYDPNGHGTQSMGIIVGGSVKQIGMAPQAKWIAVKIFNDSGTATSTAIHQGFQWLLNPNGDPNNPGGLPNVVNNSWAMGTPGCNLEFQSDLQALLAVGITPVFASGNYGPNANTSVSPANLPEAFSVGAVNNSKLIYAYSSRGPTTCGSTASRIYPNVVAPGVTVNTSDLFKTYKKVSGTSISAPHVTGAIALLLSYNHNLTVTQLETALSAAALDLGAVGPDSNYGSGLINVLASYNYIVAGRV
jgi:subtilisin family serine protease